MKDPIPWLLEGDPSIVYQTRKYLLLEPEHSLIALRKDIARTGWGRALLDARSPSGHWSRGFYQVKWVCSHYVLADLRNLEIEPTPEIMETLQIIIDTCRAPDGSITESRAKAPGDLCVNGMFLDYASYFGVQQRHLQDVVDYLLSHRMEDGGFNCESTRAHVRHSSMHTTISVLEGIRQYLKGQYSYRAEELSQAQGAAKQFLLSHRLFLSDTTGRVIDPRWLMLSYPSRWHYDILRALTYFASADSPYDRSMDEALQVLTKKRLKDGRWPVQAAHPGKVHVVMEQPGTPSRWNTLRSLRVLKYAQMC